MVSDKWLDISKNELFRFVGSPVLIGGGSGFLTRLLVQPFDVVKIRFQLQWEGTGRRSTAHSRYSSIRQAFVDIGRTEGLSALWKGHVPAQMLSVVYASSQFYVYEKTFAYVSSVHPDISKIGERFVCGGMAGIAATLCAQPLDTIRTRFIAQGTTYHYHSVGSAVRNMYSESGIRCFYKGLLPTIIEIFPATGIHFMIFYSGQEVIARSFNTSTSFVLLLSNFSLGLSAGLIAKLATHPIDVCKKRMQIQGFQFARADYGRLYTYNSFSQCLQKIVVEEGFFGFYKGLLPNLLKASLSSGLHFTFYELGCRFLKEEKNILF